MVDQSNWLTLASVAVAGFVAVATALGADRTKSRVEALRLALELKDNTGLDVADRTQLDRFIKYTAAALGDVWWRHPLVQIGAVLAFLGVVQLVVAFVTMATGELEASYWWNAGGCVVAGFALAITMWFVAKKRGYRG